MFTLICARINGWVNNREAGDLRRYRGHYDVTVMAAVDSRRISDQYIWISYFPQKVICVTNLPWQWCDLLDIETFSRYLHVDVLHRHHGPWTQSLWVGQYQWCAIMHWWLRSKSGLWGHWLCPVPKTLLYEWRNRYKIAPEKCDRCIEHFLSCPFPAMTLFCAKQWSHLGPLLLTWFSFTPSMDKWLHPLWRVGWNYLSIPKL